MLWILFSLKGNSAICNNIHEFGGHCVNKQSTKMQIQHRFNICESNRVELMKVGKWMVGITRLGGWTSLVHSFNLIEKYIFKTYCII